MGIVVNAHILFRSNGIVDGVALIAGQDSEFILMGTLSIVC